MGRTRTIEVAAVNVTMQAPHSASRYVELIEALARQRHPAPIRGEYHAMIGSVRPIREEHPEQGLTGEIYKYFELDPHAAWFNIAKNQMAEAKERDEVRIPRELKPHFSLFFFVFYPRGHRLFFSNRPYGNQRLTPNAAAKMLRQLTERQNILRQFGPISVTVEPAAESLDRILKMATLRRISIEITPPNADTLASASAKMMKRLTEMNAQKELVELTASPGKSLVPDQELRQTAEIAQSNGVVTGEGFDAEGKRVRESTEQHPLIARDHYEPDVEEERQVLIRRSEELAQWIRHREQDGGHG